MRKRRTSWSLAALLFACVLPTSIVLADINLLNPIGSIFGSIIGEFNKQNLKNQNQQSIAAQQTYPVDGGLNLDSAQRKRVQESLALRGYRVGVADGVFGPRTLAAIRSYQQDAGLPATGAITRELYQQLTSEQYAAPVAPPAPAKARKLSREQRQELQQRLADKGYNVGVVDGVVGPLVRTAMRQYAIDQGSQYRFHSQIYDMLQTAPSARPGETGTGTPQEHLTAAPANIDTRHKYYVSGSAKNIDYKAKQQANAQTEQTLLSMLLASKPTLLDTQAVLHRLYRKAGNPEPNPYVLEETLAEFKPQALSQLGTVPESVDVTLYETLVIKAGGYDKIRGVYPLIHTQSILQSSPLAKAMSDTAARGFLTWKAPSPSREGYETTWQMALGQNLPVLELPLPLEEAIALEDAALQGKYSDFGKKNTRVVRRYTLKLVLRIQRPDTLNSAGKSNPNGFTAVGPAKLLNIELLDLSSASASKPFGTFVRRFEISATQVQTQHGNAGTQHAALFKRLELTTLDGKLLMSQSKNNQNARARLAAALAVGQSPALLDKPKTALLLASILLSAEQIQVLETELGFSIRGKLGELESQIASEAINARYKENLLSFALKPPFGIVVDTPVTVGKYDLQRARYPLKFGRGGTSNGVLQFLSNRGFKLSANLDATPIPTGLTANRAEALALNKKFKSGSYAAVLQQSTVVTSVKQLAVSSSLSAQISVNMALQLEVLQQRLLNESGKKVIRLFKADPEEKQRLQRVLDALHVPVVANNTLLNAALTFIDDPAVTEAFISGQRALSSADEFDKTRVREALQQTLNNSPWDGKPVWLHGTAILGNFDSDTSSFPVISYALSGRGKGNISTLFSTLKIELLSPLKVKTTEAIAIGATRAFPDRKFAFRMLANILGAALPARSSQSDRFELLVEPLQYAVVGANKNVPRSRWVLVGQEHPSNNAESGNGDNSAAQPTVFNSNGQLSKQYLLLAAAKSAIDNLSDRSLDWLMTHQWKFEQVENQLGRSNATFFDGKRLEHIAKSMAHHRPLFKQWLARLELPPLGKTTLLIDTRPQGHQTDVRNFHTAKLKLVADVDRGSSSSKELNALEGLSAGFLNIDKWQCSPTKNKAKKMADTCVDWQPKVDLKIDVLPLQGNSVHQAIELQFSTAKISFGDNGDDIPHVSLAIEMRSAALIRRMSGEPDIVAQYNRQELEQYVSTQSEAQAREQAPINTDIIGITPGMPLDEAKAILGAHMTENSSFLLAREFSTRPEYLGRAELYIAKSGSEYLALFYETDDAAPAVLGVMRGLRLPSGKLDRNKAMAVLRHKYGAEKHIDANYHLRMLWGHGVVEQSNSGSSKENQACKIKWSNSFPQKLKPHGSDGASTREIMGRKAGNYVSWPSLYINQDLTSCGQYLTAFHQQGDNDILVVAAFDMPLIQQSMRALLARVAAVRDGENSGTAPPEQKEDLDFKL